MERAAHSIDDINDGPRLDPGWHKAFVLEARLRDLTGDQIGDALAVVEAHLAESGESVHEAFGDPEAYAGILAEQVGPGQPAGPLSLRTGLGVASGVLGLALIGPGTRALAGDGLVPVSAGLVLSVVATLLAAFVVTRHPTPVLRWLASVGPLRCGGAALLLVGALVGLLLLWRDPLIRARGDIVCLVSAGLLLVGTWALWPDRAGDPVRDPRSGRLDRAPVLTWVTALLFPLAGLLIAGLSWLLPG